MNQPFSKKPIFWIIVGLGILLDILGATFLGNILPVVAAALISLLAIIIIFLKLIS